MMMTTTKKKKIQQEEEEKPNPGGGGGGGGGGADRISELPIEILHRILGFLEMDELLIGTSLVSTKWRNLWKSVSTLKFPTCMISIRRTDDDDPVVDNGGGGGGLRNNVEKFQNFVDNVLRLRDSQVSKIEVFRYYYYCDHYSNSRGGGGGGVVDYEDLERLHNFIVSAVVNQGAQEIRIFFAYLDLDESSDNNNRIIHLNPFVFSSLRKFTFNVHSRHFQIQFPRSMCCATQLAHLFLAGIRLPEGDDDAQLHLVCPILEKLMIHNCYSEHLKVLDISAPRLDTLSIENCGVRLRRFDGLGGCRLEIHTPNLTTLDYAGCGYVDCFTENLPHVFFVNLDFTKVRGMLEQTTSFAIKLLKGLTSAKSLILEGFEVLSQDTLKDLLTSFTSLRTLKLITSCKISSIHGMVHFLNSCNFVEKLVWKVVHMYEFVEVEGDEHLILPQCRLTHLKHVHIKRLCGHKNAIEFVKFLLKSSVVLEDLIINTTENSPKRFVEENLKQFVEENPLFGSVKLQIV